MRNPKRPAFTLVELLLVIAMFGILSASAMQFFNQSFTQYLNLTKDSESFNSLAMQSQRVARVLRGLTDITSASTNDLTVYAYFSPADTYVSEIRYYKNPAGDKLLADITQMTSNPPVGTLIASSKKTYTIIDNFNTVSGVNLFTYVDSADNTLSLPISDLHIIKGIKISLSTKNTSLNKVPTTMTMQVSLRNRKTNL